MTIDINSSDDLEKWLAGKPLEWAQVVAVRAALRVQPVANEILTVPDNLLDPDLKKGLILQTFRAGFISWAACRYPAQEMSIAFAAAAVTAAATDAVTATAAVTAARAADARDAATVTAATVTAARAADARAAAAVTATAAAVTAAARAAVTATAAAAIWASVESDCAYLELNPQLETDLIFDPLWLGGLKEDTEPLSTHPEWVRASLNLMRKHGADWDPCWQVPERWYLSILPAKLGQIPKSAFGAAADIEIATKPDEFWTITEDRTAEDILREILDIANLSSKKSEWDFFLSYSEQDEAAARRISNVLESAGYSVFSQFNDMTAGKSFVGEMNRGLEGMGRFLALYSEDYFSSDHCQSEWESAYSFDASGEATRIVPFMVRACAPSPLARRLVWVPLMGLPPDQERNAILDAIQETSTPKSRTEQRALWKERISPDVKADATGTRLEAGANAVFDEPFVETDLLELPERLRALIKTALAALTGRNSPSGFPAALEGYLEELNARGPNCSVGLLKDLMACIEAEIDADEADYWCSGKTLTTALEKIRENHARLMAHYPLDQNRERLLRTIEVDQGKFDPDASRNRRTEFLNATREAYQADFVTDAYKAAVENRDRVTRDSLDLKTPEVPETGDEEFRLREQDRIRRIEDAKKRALAQHVGFADKSLDVLGKMTKVADSPSVQRLVNAMRELADWFW